MEKLRGEASFRASGLSKWETDSPTPNKHEPGRERTVFVKYGVGFKNNRLEVLHSHDIPEASGFIKRFNWFEVLEFKGMEPAPAWLSWPYNGRETGKEEIDFICQTWSYSCYTHTHTPYKINKCTRTHTHITPLHLTHIHIA